VRRLAQLIGPRSRVLLVVVLVGIWAAWELQLFGARDAQHRQAKIAWATVGEFFSAALAPAVDYEQAPPAGTDPLLKKVAAAIWQTVIFATAAVGLALVAGVVLAFLASSAWWEDDPVGGHTRLHRILHRLIAPTVVWLTRTVIVVARSVHELLWAVLFLCAIGFNSLTAILAIAIPYSGVFAKVFSEMIDEAPRDAAYAIRGSGARPTRVFLFGLLPRALPDMTAYACYRLECGMRSSAVLGFFGVQTLGYYLKPAFQEQHYHEVWTYLYALIALVIFVDWWSGMMRRRLVH
jgi:phosphonate transport system permease protein